MLANRKLMVQHHHIECVDVPAQSFAAAVTDYWIDIVIGLGKGQPLRQVRASRAGLGAYVRIYLL